MMHGTTNINKEVYVYNCAVQNSSVISFNMFRNEKKVGLQYNVLGREYPSINWRQTTACLFSVAASRFAGFKITEQCIYRGADKSLARPGRKQTTATEDFEFHISY
jgi:hypothetical protein